MASPSAPDDRRPERPTLGSRTPARRTSKRRWAVDDYLSYLLARASHDVASEFHLEVRAAGWTVLEWRVLATLAGDPCTVGQLASIVMAEQSTVTKLLGRLEAEGRIVRSDDAMDRRRSLVQITPAARADVAPLLARSKRHERALVARLEPHEAEALKSALRKLIDAG